MTGKHSHKPVWYDWPLLMFAHTVAFLMRGRGRKRDVNKRAHPTGTHGEPKHHVSVWEK